MSNIHFKEFRKGDVSEVVDSNNLAHNNNMNDFVSKDLLEAKLETIESRMDARVVSIESGIKATNEKIDSLLSDIKSLKSTTITVAVGAVLTILFGIAGFNAALLSNMVASYESGKNTATAISESTNELKNTREELSKISKTLADKQ